MIKLYLFFGIVGFASIVAWLAVLVLLIAYARHPKRNMRYLCAMGVAILAYVLAQINSSQVNAIQVDQTEELEAASKRQQQIRDESDGAGRVHVRFAEDSSKDRLDVAGISTNEVRILTGDMEPAYRQQGRQARDAGKKKDVVVAGTGKIEEAAAGKEKPARLMKADDVYRADRLDRYNLFLVRMFMWVSALAFVGDYLWRLNRTFLWYFPLPISGHWLDRLFRKSHAVLLLNQKANIWKEFAEGVVRKGETFIYFGENDLWPTSRLPRLVVGKKGVFPLQRVIYGASGVPREDEFFFDSAWFKHYCVVVSSPDDAVRLTRELVSYLDRRHATRAIARQTVNVVWNLGAPPDEPVIRKLVSLSGETNFKFILSVPGQVPESIARYFDEVHPDGVARLAQTPRRVEDFEQEREAKRQASAARKAEKDKAAEEKRRLKDEERASKQASAHGAKEKEERERADAEQADAEKRKRELEARAKALAPSKGVRKPGPKVGARVGGKPLLRRPDTRAPEPEKVGAPAGAKTDEKLQAVEQRPGEPPKPPAEDPAKAVGESVAPEAKDKVAPATPATEPSQSPEDPARKEAEARAREDADKAAALERQKRHEEAARREAEARARDEEIRAANLERRRKAEETAREKAAQEARETAAGASKEKAEPEAPATDTAAPHQQQAGAAAETAAAGSFTFLCPKCSQVLGAEPAWVGMEVTCPLCATVLVVPQPGAGASGEPPAAAPAANTSVTTFTITCPSCQQVLTAQSDWVGLEVKCPLCSQSMVVPPAPAAT